MPPYTLARTTFPRKADAEKRVQQILHSTPLHQRLVDDELRLIIGVLARHPHSDEKLKDGITGITVAMNIADTGISSRGFQVIRPDGSYTAFSYIRALGTDNCKKGIDGKSIDDACRYAVAESIIEFKLRAFGTAETVACAETGMLTEFDDCDVHHAEPWTFKKIVAAFIEQNGDTPVRKRLNGDFGSEFVYPKDVSSFRKFHDSLAVLEIVNRDVHHKLRVAQLQTCFSHE